jgi:hypothetical protein
MLCVLPTGLGGSRVHRAVVGKDSIFTDKLSGAKDDRPGLGRCLKALKSGDTLVVWRLDRLGRSMRHLVTVIGKRPTLNRVPGSVGVLLEAKCPGNRRSRSIGNGDNQDDLRQRRCQRRSRGLRS